MPVPKQSEVEPELRSAFDTITADFKAAGKGQEEEIKEKEEKDD
jgi:hypothetical protein